MALTVIKVKAERKAEENWNQSVASPDLGFPYKPCPKMANTDVRKNSRNRAYIIMQCQNEGLDERLQERQQGDAL